MNDRNLMILGGMIGALVGVGVGFTLFTDRGRKLRSELQPEIEAVLREAARLTQVVEEFKAGRPLAPAGAAAGAAAGPRRTA